MRNISLIRIDNRLIHGQIVQGWLPSLSVKEIIVISDTAAASKLMGKMMRMSLPQEYALTILSTKEAPSYLSSEEDNKVLVLMEDIETLSVLVKEGLTMKEINIGNTKYEEGKKQYGQGVFLSEEELSQIKELVNTKGLTFILQTLPTSLSQRLF